MNSPVVALGVTSVMSAREPVGFDTVMMMPVFGPGAGVIVPVM